MANVETHLPDPARLLQSPQILLPAESACKAPCYPPSARSLTWIQVSLSSPSPPRPCSAVSPSLLVCPPSLPLSDLPCCAPAQKANPFYEEWWFLVVIALVGLIFILLLVFVLIIRGQSKKYAKKSDSGEHQECGGWTWDPLRCQPGGAEP